MVVDTKQSDETAQVCAQQMDGDATIFHIVQTAFQHVRETIDEHIQHLPFLLRREHSMEWMNHSLPRNEQGTYLFFEQSEIDLIEWRQFGVRAGRNMLIE